MVKQKKEIDEELNEAVSKEPKDLEPISIPKKENIEVVRSSINEMTMDAFLSNSVEIKKAYNKYVTIGFTVWYKQRRQKDKSIPIYRTYDSWLQQYKDYAERKAH